MTCIIKSSYDIDNIRIASQLAAAVLEMITPHVKSGISTGELDDICSQYIINKQHAIPASFGYRGFPKSVCISVNDVVCHGIPNYNTKIKNNDIINIDVAVIKNGFYGDTSKMFLVGKSTVLGQHICQVSQESLYLAIRMIRPGIRLCAIGIAIQKFVEAKKFSVVREYCGHGIGKNFHEDPQVLHYNAYDGGIILKSGMIFTIEPMINAGKCNTIIMEDGWTVKTKDHSLSAQYEHTILVTQDGCEILTLRTDDSLPNIIRHTV